VADKSVIHCPLCGNKVPLGVTKCPVCATELQELTAKRSAEGLLERPSEDFLHREIPKIVLPDAKHTCPLCAIELSGKEAKCPRCGVPLSMPKEEELLECPECGALAPFGSRSCPKCGIGFEEVPGPPPGEEFPPPEPMLPEPIPERPIPPRHPIVEVVTTVPTGVPTTSQGLTNGRGAINGTGLVNGTGMINGTKGETRLQTPLKQKMFITRWQFLAVLIALVIVIPTFIYLSYSQEPRVFAVDGEFSEWSHVDKFGMYTQAPSASIAVTEWAVESDGSRLFLYVNAEGAIMSSSDVSSYYLFVDSDNSALTGYLVSGIGADYLLQLDGWNDSVQSTTLSEYTSPDDKFDWNSWDSIGSLSSLSAGNELEAMAEMSFTLSDSARFMLMTQNSQEQQSMSYTVPEKGGLLVIEVVTGTGVQLGGLVDQAASISLMRLNLTCEGEGGTVNRITPSVTGASLVSPIEDISLEAGEDLVVDILVDTSSAQAGSAVTVKVGPDTVESTFANLQFLGESISAYVISAPSEIRIDGAFADWAGKTTADSDAISNQNDNIDIDAVGAVNGTSYSAFYVSVVGEMCSGSYVPVIKQKPSGGGGGGIIIPTKKTGEDILRIYIDSDMNNASGYAVTLSSKVIGADYLVEVRGLDGDIVSRSLMSYSSGRWINSSSINAANDRQRLEINVSSSSLGGASSIDFIVETTDWRLRTDLATAVPLGTKSLIGGVPSGASILSWHIESPTASSSATAMSYQRKLFYDGINYWSFYFDGTNTVYRYSTDYGRTWTLGGQAFSTALIDEASIWYDSMTATLYIIGDHSTASTSVHVRQGTVASATHTITWNGTDVQPVVSNVPLGGKNTYISRDSSGYVWLMSGTCNQSAPVRYQLSVFRSTAVNSTETWGYSGNMLAGSGDPGPGVKGSIVNIGTGATMLAVYGYSGNVSARTYAGAWSAENQIYAIGNQNPGNTDNAPPCVVVDGRGVAHVVYGNGHEQKPISKPYIYYVYYNGAWSVPYRLDAVANNKGNMYPTVSVDSATGNVFAFWIEADTAAVPLIIVGKKNVTGTWTSIALSGDITSPKQYLNSIYSASNEQLVCWQWTQNTTGTIEVEFDKIPEFSDIALPVLGMAAVIVLGYRNRCTRRRRDSTED